MKKKKTSRGLLVLVNCLNEIIDSSGKRNKLFKNAHGKILEAHKEAEKYISAEKINKLLKISKQKIFRMQVENKCSLSAFKQCFKLYPSQLSLAEQKTIHNYLSDPKFKYWPINHIWAEAQRGGLYVSLPSIYKYANNTPYERNIKEIIIPNKRIPVYANRVFEILHMDSTTFRCESGERVYVHFIMDNFSRTILGAVPSFSSKSKTVAKNLREIIAKYNLFYKPFELYCDDGPENHGYVNALLNDKKIVITKIVANYKTNRSNNMIEAWNKKFKQIILRRFKPTSFEELEKLMPYMIEYFNDLKLPVLKTLSPHEVLKGVKYEDFGIKIK